MLHDSKVKRLANAKVKASGEGFPMKDIQVLCSTGRRLIYISMGTVATAEFWNAPFGKVAAENGLEDCTGKRLIQHVYHCCIEALGEDDDFVVVMSLGPHSDALEGLPALPSNFIVRQAVPQLEVLQQCTAFLTHGGANSVHEALSFGVPMVVVPCFGDQPLNADSVVGQGAGLGFRHPLDSVSVEALHSAFQRLAATRDNSFRVAARQLAAKIKEAGGVDAAAEAVLEVAERSELKVSRGGA